MMHGARRWYFPDGYLPKGRKNDLSSHESICILNANEEDAEIKIHCSSKMKIQSLSK